MPNGSEGLGHVSAPSEVETKTAVLDQLVPLWAIAHLATSAFGALNVESASDEAASQKETLNTMATPPSSAFDAEMMAIAIRMADRGNGDTAPNPSVGA